MELKKSQVHFEGENPMVITEIPGEVVTLTEDQERIIKQVTSSIKAYIVAAEELASGKYAHLRDIIPAYLSTPGNVLVSCGTDGVVVRYERRVDKRRVGISWRPESLSEFVTMVSQRIVRCDPPGTTHEVTDQDGIALSMFMQDGTTGDSKDISSVRLVLTAVLQPPEAHPQPPRKPFCLLSCRSEFSIHIHGEMIDEISGEVQPFLTLTQFRIPAGWDCIEVFPFLELSHWIPENAASWAETDILASVAARQHQNATLNSLDPHAATRKAFAAELKAFKDLLDTNPEREEELHVFLKNHPYFLCPSHSRMWSKLPFGSKESDFVFRDATGDYLLVEIERSTLRLFIQTGDKSADLNHACSQITDWKRYIQHNLSTVQNELGLASISPNPRSLVVIGRSADLTPENRAKMVTMETETHNQKIMTYDDVYLNAKAVIENMFGPLEIVGPDTQMFYLRKP